MSGKQKRNHRSSNMLFLFWVESVRATERGLPRPSKSKGKKKWWEFPAAFTKKSEMIKVSLDSANMKVPLSQENLKVELMERHRV